jgi:hypothetical protein
MPQLKSISLADKGQSAIIYGPSQSGKTTLACGLAKKFKVLYVDGENGTPVLFTLPQAWQDNIFVQKVLDNKDNANFGLTAIAMASGEKVQVCDAHGVVMNYAPAVIKPCAECKALHAAKMLELKPTTKAEDLARLAAQDLINEWQLKSMLPSEWVIIFDSLTQITSSLNAYITKGLKGDFDFEEFKHWRAQGTLLEKFLDYIQTAGYNCVVISHEEGIKQEDGTEKIVPSAGTSNFARKVPRYFNSALYCTTKNKKHVVYSTTTADTRVIAGTRGGITIDMASEDTRANSLCELFGKK